MQVEMKARAAVGDLIPHDWKLLELGSIGRVIRGASPRPKGDKRFYGGQVPRLMVEDVTRDGRYVTPSVDFLTDAGAKLSRPCKKGTLTIVCSGTVGVPSILAVDACIHDGFLALVSIDREVSAEYLYYRLSSLREKFESSATHGGVFTNLTTSILREFRVAVPPLPEQRAIATALSDVDALINSLDRLIAKKRDIKQATMQQLLTGKTRLPGFSGGWDARRLGEIGECIIGLTYRPENVVPYGLLVLRSSNIQNEKLCFEDNVFVNIAVPNKLVVQDGDILICVRNGSRALIGKCVRLDHRTVGSTFGAFMSVYRTPYSRFISQVFKTHSIQRQIYENIGATINQITNSNLKSFDILLPSIDEQEAICNILDDMDREISALEKRREKTILLKQGMMQELLTGRTRLA